MSIKPKPLEVVTIYAGTAGEPLPGQPITQYALWIPGVGPLRLQQGNLPEPTS